MWGVPGSFVDAILGSLQGGPEVVIGIDLRVFDGPREAEVQNVPWLGHDLPFE